MTIPGKKTLECLHFAYTEQQLCVGNYVQCSTYEREEAHEGDVRNGDTERQDEDDWPGDLLCDEGEIQVADTGLVHLHRMGGCGYNAADIHNNSCTETRVCTQQKTLIEML